MTLTVYTQMRTISTPRAHHTQLVQVEMFAPLNTVTTMTAAIHITYSAQKNGVSFVKHVPVCDVRLTVENS